MAKDDNRPSKSSRRGFLKVAGSAAAAVSLAGCSGGGGGGSGGDSGGSGGSDGSGGSGGSDGGGDGGSDGGGGDGEEMEVPEVYVPDLGTSGAAVNHLDPAFAVDFSQGIVANLYDPLVMEDPETHAPTAHLAEEWETESDTTWVFNLRDDVKFHSGNQFTAEDVAYSLRRIMDLGAPFGSFWKGQIDPESGIEVRDDTTIALTTNSPMGPLIGTLVQLKPVDKQVVQEQEKDGDWGNEWLENNEAGTGAYMLSNYVQGDHLEYEWFPDYFEGWDWHEGRQFKKARTGAVKEQSTIILTFDDREAVSTQYNLNPETFEKLSTKDGVKILTNPQLSLNYMPMNCRLPPFDDINVRKAACHAFDYQTAIEDIHGGGVVAQGPVPVEMFGHNGDVAPYERDLDKAKDFLDKAEYSVDQINNEESHQVVIHQVEGVGPLERMGLLLQSNLSEIGIEAKVQKTPWPQYTGLVTDAETTPKVGGHYNSIKNLSPDSHTYLMYHPDSQGSYLSMDWYTDEELTAVLEQARGSLDREERIGYYKEAQQMIRDAYPSIFIANPIWRIAQSEEIEGTKYYGMLQWEMQFHDWRWSP